MASTMPHDLWSLCVVAEGFPHTVCPAEVAEVIASTTRVKVQRLANLPSEDSSPVWLLCLSSHDEQKKCLVHHMTLKTKEFGRVKLIYPPQSLHEGSQELTWIDIENEIPMDERPCSVVLEDQKKKADMEGMEGSKPSRPILKPRGQSPGWQSDKSLEHLHPSSSDLNLHGPEGSGFDQFFQPPRYPGMGRGRIPDFFSQSGEYMSGPEEGSGAVNLQSGMPFSHPHLLSSPEESFNNFESDFVVLDSDMYLRVTDLPDAVSETELQEFFQDRKQSGGDHVTKIELDNSTHSANVCFGDSEVVQRVEKRTPLLFKNKKITVVAAHTGPKQHDEDKKTVEIRNLTADDTELCLLYFENPKKSGGGEVENSNWNEEENVLYITFQDAEAAKRVVAQGHKVGGTVLEVSLYVPPKEEMKSMEESHLPQCTVEVSGIDPDNFELYEMYFSNPNKGGDTIKEMNLSEDNTVLFVTFEKPEVAERVAKRTHNVGGKQLEVVLVPIEEPTPPNTVMVENSEEGQQEMLELYFGNPRKGGGDIKEIAWNSELQAFLITFEDSEVAQSVLKQQHKVGGQDLRLSLYKPSKKKAKHQQSREPEEKEEPPLRTVVFNVDQHGFESKDTYGLYFESRHCGSGEVENIEFDSEKQLVYITFTDPAVAQRVSGMTHKVGGKQLEVTLYVPPKPRPTYTNKLLFKNVADNTTKECLIMFIERMTALEPEEILYGDEVGTVLITFSEEPDFEKAQQFCQKRPLEGRHLVVSKVPISNCLLVENMSSKTTEDTVELYFEGKRSNGGEIEKIEMVPEENKCFVYFVDHQVLDKVLSKQHKLDGSKLTVKRYMECLGQSGGSDDPTAFTMPKPMVLDKTDPYKVAFLRASQSAIKGLCQEMEQNYAHIRFEGDRVIIECTITHTIPKARILARTWEVDARLTFENYVNVVDMHRREVMQQLWEEVAKAVDEKNIPKMDGAFLFPSAEEHAFIVVGMKSFAKELFVTVCTIVKETEEIIERRNQEVTETNTRLKSYQLRLLLAMGFQVEGSKRHDGIKITIQIPKNAITFQGLLKDVKEAQVEMYDLINNTKLDKVTGMSDMQKKLMDNKLTRKYIVQKFKQENIQAVWEISQDDVVVHAFDDSSLVKAVHIVKKSVPEHICILSPESVELLSRPDWQSLVAQFKTAHPGVLLITPSSDSQKIYITCIDGIMHGVMEEVEKFFEENTVYSQTVKFSPSRQAFVVQKWQTKIAMLADNLRAYKVQVQLKEANTEFYIRGTKKGLEEMHTLLQGIEDKILCHAENFHDQSKVKFLQSDCQKDLQMIGRSSNCILAQTPEPAGLQVVSSDTFVSSYAMSRVTDVEACIRAQLSSGICVSVVQGDITQLKVDAIVNAANERMDHIGGLARDIVSKGGDVIQQECHRILKSQGNKLKEGDVIMSGAGRLPCKAVIHAVGPMYKGGRSGEEECLFETVMKTLEITTSANHESIAIPAISTGIFGYPSRESTRVIVEAVKAFLESRKRHTLKNIYLCHIGSEIVQLFTEAVQKSFPDASGISPAIKAVPKSRRGGQTHSQSFVGFAGAASPDTTYKRVIAVSIVAGEIARQTVDVIVNSTSNGLDLQNGAVSGSILDAAGPGLQTECKTNYPRGINSFDIARTTGHNLNCQEVFHVALCNFTNPQAQQVLGLIVSSCLKEASKRRYTSLAFPVMGTGNLGFPPSVVAQTMLDAIDQFQAQTPSTSLKDVRIVVYHSDTAILKEFQRAQSGRGGTTFTPPQPSGHGTSSTRQNRQFSDMTYKPGSSGASGGSSSQGEHAVFEIGGLKFVIKYGDITEEDTEAIVNSTNSQLDFRRGGVAGSLRKKCGKTLEDECKQKVDDMNTFGVIITKAPGLRSKTILHLNADKFHNDWEEGIQTCLELAEKNQIRSVAMPAFGTGIGFSPTASASAMFETLVKIYKSGQHCVKEVRVVLFDKKMIAPFVSTVQSKGEKHNKKSKGFFNFVMSAFSGGPAEVKQTVNNPVTEEPQEASLFIYGESQNDIHTALKTLDEIVKDRITHRELTDEVIAVLKPSDIERIHTIAHQHNVDINIQQRANRITADGMSASAFDCMQAVSSILREVERRRQQQEAASMLANMIEWCYLEVTTTGTVSQPYQPKENHIVETAFQNKKKTAEISDKDGNVFIIDFDSMMEYPRNDINDKVSVIRRDKIRGTGQIPENWEAHSQKETVKVVPLQSTDQEYQTVANQFKLTVPNVHITGIHRVQNPHLYQQYLAKKAHLERQNPSGTTNELTLWHGTSPDAIQNINHHGFNRSFCGKNATAYGQGVYFAVNANYSASTTYSPPDPAGNRTVYQCRVLVGVPTRGSSAMRVLPARSGHILFDSATDNPNGPSLYVIFNDTQAYPEYMITFK